MLRFLLFLTAACLAAPGAEVLSGFRPSPVRSDYGLVSEVAFSTPVVEVEAGALAHHLPHAMNNYRFAESVWVIAYKTDIVDTLGKRPSEDYLCHTFFGDQRVVQHQDQEMNALYSDAFTPEVRLPDGFGVRLTPDENLHWMPMFNNRGALPTRVAMRVKLTVIRTKDLKKPLRPLYSTLRSVQVPHLYFVPPGRHDKQMTFTQTFDGRIHALGTHIHPYGVSIELYNLSRGERVWIGRRKLDVEGLMAGMDVYSSREGYPVRAGETYRVTAVYENTTKDPIDAVAGLFLFYSRN